MAKPPEKKSHYYCRKPAIVKLIRDRAKKNLEKNKNKKWEVSMPQSKSLTRQLQVQEMRNSKLFVPVPSASPLGSKFIDDYRRSHESTLVNRRYAEVSQRMMSPKAHTILEQAPSAEMSPTKPKQ